MRRVCGIIAPAALLLFLSRTALGSVTVDEEEVVFRLDAPRASSVYLVGDFNNWNPTVDAMVRRDGSWEARLYLVPGRYRYRFIVDEASIADPDHPHRDEEGNSFFIFHAANGRYEILFAAPVPRDPGTLERIAAGGRFRAAADRDAALFAAAVDFEGDFEEGLTASARIALECESETEREAPARAYMLRAAARRYSERAFVEAFHRAGELDFGDPLELFGTVGPFRYPLGLFCRGVAAGAAGPFGVRGRVFYANRIEGYRSGLEEDFTHLDESFGTPAAPFAGAREDADMIGLSLRGGGRILDLEYLYRRDRGPGDILWRAPGDSGSMLTGYRGFDAHGVVVRVELAEAAKIDAQLLAGRTTLNPLDPADAAGETRRFAAPLEWEDGYRVSLGMDFARAGRSAGLRWRRTALDGDPSLREGRSEGVRDVFEARFEAPCGPLRVTAALRGERFGSDDNTGRVFWLARRNFWLDGDQLHPGLIPFVDAHRVWEARICAEERADSIAGPIRGAGYAAAVLRSAGAAAVFEITAGKGVGLARGFSLHADMRHVAYHERLSAGRDRFFGAWIGIRSSISEGGWIVLGAGVPPYRFDRWRYDFTADGREAFLLETGLFGSFERRGEPAILERLGSAERLLERERRIHFEAGFAF